MVNFLLKLRRKKQYRAHRDRLEKICDFGAGFGTSPSNSSRDQAYMQFKVNVLPVLRKCVTIGENCNLAATMLINEHGSVEIGDYIYMNGVHMRIDHQLRIGNHCMFGPGVKLWDTNNHPLSVSERHSQCEYIAHEGFIDSYSAGGGDIVIEEDVWIGMDALILGPVRVGRGAVIAARSVVTRDVPPMVLVAGVPSKVIGSVPQ